MEHAAFQRGVGKRRLRVTDCLGSLAQVLILPSNLGPRHSAPKQLPPNQQGQQGTRSGPRALPPCSSLGPTGAHSDQHAQQKNTNPLPPPHDRRCRNQEDRNAYEHRNGGGLTMHTMLENDRRFAPGKISASRGTPLWSS